MRALIVSYGFPPVGGAGVQRVVKLVKYLPAHGITPSVLTVANPSVPVVDHSLDADLPRDLRVVRARTFEPGYAVKQAAWSATAQRAPSWSARIKRQLTGIARQLLVPDPQILWQPAAQAALARELMTTGTDVVMVSGPPFSQFLLAPLVRASGAKLVLDYRDEWSTYRTTYEMMGGLARVVGGPLESALLRSAHAVTTATEEFRAHLLQSFSFLQPEEVRAIPNGYDSDDFPAQLPEPPVDKFVITYAGTIFRLTSARGFLGALRKLHAVEPELAAVLEVRFFGRIVDTEADAFVGSEDLGVQRLGYIDHGLLLPKLAESHLVLCLLDEVAGNERIYPAKIFELMRLQRPTLTLAPPGALTKLVERHHLGAVLPPRDEEGIARYLEARLREFVNGKYVAASAPVDIARYDRNTLAGEFAAVFRSRS